MPLEVTAYLAEDGSLHANACEAAKRDLEAIIAASPLAENGPYAKLLLEWMTDRSGVILQVLGEYHTACPRAIPAEEEAPMDLGEGPVALKAPPLEDSHAPYCSAHNGFPCDCGYSGRNEAEPAAETHGDCA